MREKHQAQPTSPEWSTGAPTNEGDAILAGVACGAATDLLDDAWWGPTIPLPNGAWFCLAERNLPGSILVNGAGKRFMNEAMPYVEAGHAIYAGEATGVQHVPCWLVFDQPRPTSARRNSNPLGLSIRTRCSAPVIGLRIGSPRDST